MSTIHYIQRVAGGGGGAVLRNFEKTVCTCILCV